MLTIPLLLLLLLLMLIMIKNNNCNMYYYSYKYHLTSCNGRCVINKLGHVFLFQISPTLLYPFLWRYHDADITECGANLWKNNYELIRVLQDLILCFTVSG